MLYACCKYSCAVGCVECSEGDRAPWCPGLPPQATEHEGDIQIVRVIIVTTSSPLILHSYSLERKKSWRESGQQLEPPDSHLAPVSLYHAIPCIYIYTCLVQIFRRLQTLGLNEEYEESLLVCIIHAKLELFLRSLGMHYSPYHLRSILCFDFQELKDLLLKQYFNKQL